MIPTSIQIMHELENHEHTVCNSINVQHIHELDNDCDEFHKQLTTYSMNFASNYDVIPEHFYATNFIDKPQLINEVYQTKKSSRGPPNFTV